LNAKLTLRNLLACSTQMLHLEKKEEELVQNIVCEEFRYSDMAEPERKILRMRTELEIQITLEVDSHQFKFESYIMLTPYFRKAGPNLDSSYRTLELLRSVLQQGESVDLSRSKLAFCDEKHGDCRMGAWKEVVWPKRLLKIELAAMV